MSVKKKYVPRFTTSQFKIVGTPDLKLISLLFRQVFSQVPKKELMHLGEIRVQSYGGSFLKVIFVGMSGAHTTLSFSPYNRHRGDLKQTINSIRKLCYKYAKSNKYKNKFAPVTSNRIYGYTPDQIVMLEYMTGGDFTKPLPTYTTLKNYVDTAEHDYYSLRTQYTKGRSWALLAKELVDDLATFIGDRKAIDIGCGSGMLVHHLRERGVNAVGMDNFSSHTFRTYHEGIIDADYAEADLSDYDIVITSWPSYQCEVIDKVISKLRPGQILIYCGEGMGGCTGNDEFHDLLTQVFDELETPVDRHSIRWLGLHDRWEVYQRIDSIPEVNVSDVIQYNRKLNLVTKVKNGLVTMQRLDQEGLPISHLIHTAWIQDIKKTGRKL